MANLSTFDSIKPIKLLAIGDSGSGKTGALASLAKAGYKLWIIDFDQGLDILASLLRGDEPALARVEFETFTDKLKSVQGRIIPDGPPTAFARALAKATEWLGRGLGREDVLVWDSLTFSGHAALRYVLSINARSGQAPQIQDWGQAMGMLEDLLSLLYSDEVRCNVVVTSHITYVESEAGGVSKGYPTALGNKLPPKVGRWFNTMVLFKTVGSGASTKRIIKTTSEPLIELKVPVLNVPPELPISSGLADLFKLIRGGHPMKT